MKKDQLSFTFTNGESVTVKEIGKIHVSNVLIFEAKKTTMEQNAKKNEENNLINKLVNYSKKFNW